LHLKNTTKKQEKIVGVLTAVTEDCFVLGWNCVVWYKCINGSQICCLHIKGGNWILCN